MEKTNILLWAGVLLALLCILSMTTTEEFYRNGANSTVNPNSQGTNQQSGATTGTATGATTGTAARATTGATTGTATRATTGTAARATTGTAARATTGTAARATTRTVAGTVADTMPAIMTVAVPISMKSAMPTTQTTSSANAAPTISGLSTASPAPAIPSAPLRTKNTVTAPRTLTAPGAASVNIVNGKPQSSAPLSALTGGINTGARDVAAATTIDVTISPTVGNVQQQTVPGADAAAATIQNKQVPRKSVLTPSGLPSDLQSAIATYMPTNLTFRPPASILMGAPQMGVPQVGAAPINTPPMVSGTMGDIQMGARPMRHRKPRGDSCPSDDCNDNCTDDCSDDCNE